MGCAVLSLILWIINCQCWSKKSCCLKEYHNPQNIRTFWWLCFIFFCGVLACCISGILVSVNFGKKVGSAKCIYERIYYDSKYGELKNGTKWKGLENRNELIEELYKFVDNDYTKFDIDYNWSNHDFKCVEVKNVKYPPEFIKEIGENIENILDKFTAGNSKIYNNEDGRQVIYDPKCDQKSLYYEYINNATRICKNFSDQIKEIKSYIANKEKPEYKNIYKKQIGQTDEELKNISNDLDNYQGKFLDESNYFIKISKIFGYILVLIYYSIVIAIILFSCFCLWAYTYFKEQRIIYTLMHIAWNILKFFSFSFFLFGTAFGALYLCARDLIGFNQYIFTTNLEENMTKYLPTGEAKTFLDFCMKNSSDNNYINNLNIPQSIRNFYINSKTEKYIVENFNSTLISQSYNCYSQPDFRRLESDSTDGFLIINISFIEAGRILEANINELYNILSRKESLRILENGEIIPEINKLMDNIETLNCGFLKNELQILFDCLYELSIESRISCALCCCIGFFIEVAINFYLLVIYHYNNQQFKEGKDNQGQFKINQQRKFDMESQNEFLDKSKPPNLKNKNKQLDLEFSFNE